MEDWTTPRLDSSDCCWDVLEEEEKRKVPLLAFWLRLDSSRRGSCRLVWFSGRLWEAWDSSLGAAALHRQADLMDADCRKTWGVRKPTGSGERDGCYKINLLITSCQQHEDVKCHVFNNQISIHPSFYPFTHLSVFSHLFICSAIHLSIHYSIFLSVYPSICLAIHLSVRPSIRLAICLSIHPSIHPFIFLAVLPSIHPFSHPSVCPSIHLFSHLSIHPSI